MTPDRFRELLHLLGMTHTKVSSLLGCNRRQIGWWGTGRYPLPDSIADWLEASLTALDDAEMPSPPEPDLWQANFVQNPPANPETATRLMAAVASLDLSIAQLAGVLECADATLIAWMEAREPVPDAVLAWAEACVVTLEALRLPPPAWRRKAKRGEGTRPPIKAPMRHVFIRCWGDRMTLSAACRRTEINQRVIQARMRIRGETHQQAFDHFVATRNPADLENAERIYQEKHHAIVKARAKKIRKSKSKPRKSRLKHTQEMTT